MTETLKHRAKLLVILDKVQECLKVSSTMDKRHVLNVINELSGLRKELWILRSKAKDLFRASLSERACSEELWIRYEEEAGLLNSVIDQLVGLLGRGS